MKKMHLGTQVVGNYTITVDEPPLLKDEMFLQKEIPKYADGIYNSLKV